MFIGFYNYTVILTYLSACSAFVGMMQASCGHMKTALCCLAFSGLCDMFDGKVARRKKDRTEEEKMFGIQIDSLCDAVSFGMFPAYLAWQLGMKSLPGAVILAFYLICGVIRLGYFNVMEAKRQEMTEEQRSVYSGLPITSIAIILPLTALVHVFCRAYFVPVLYGVMLLTGCLFIFDFPVKKPKNSTLAILVLVVAAALLRLLLHHPTGR